MVRTNTVGYLSLILYRAKILVLLIKVLNSSQNLVRTSPHYLKRSQNIVRTSPRVLISSGGPVTKPLPDHKFLHPYGFVKVVDTISQKIDGAFAPCAPL